MLHDMFFLGPSVAEKVLRAILIYGFLLIALRAGGKRELGQLNTMDFIVLLAVANAVQNGIIGDDDSVTGAVIGATALLLVNGLAAFAASRSRQARKLLVGAPTPLVVDGVPIERNLRRQRLTIDDILQSVAEAGGSSLADVRRCVIEPNGRIAVVLADRGVTKGDLAMLRAQLDRIEQAVGRDERP